VEPTIQFLDAIMVIGHWHNFQVVDQAGMLLSQHVRALTAKTEMLAKRHPDMVATLSIVRPDTPISPKPVRDELATMMRETEQLETQTAVVLEATGIFASALRTTLKTMAVMTGNRKLKIVSTVGDGILCLLPLVRNGEGALVSRAEVEACVRKVRAAYDQHVARPATSRA
jgi:hypothetical protein